ncbi:proton-coupled zinc antiporter SLC30A2-like [Montipora foliosa]|uniref:proton-coupled zinc antiporter SLC30A2-like n=1 Tax=Montipora foliosa TaxID=591990 RepID=UPI0035F1DE8F
MKKAKEGAARRLRVASCFCLFFMILEFVGGYIANSLAIMTDAAHLLSDFAGFLISLFALWMATKPATTTLSFGWHRAEVMGAVMSVLFIWVLTGVLVYLAIQRIITRQYEINALVMLLTASAGLIINVILGMILHQKGHGHSHGVHKKKAESKKSQASPSSFVIVEEEENVNVRAAFIHVLGDFLQSVGVFIAALLIWFKPSWAIADPICTFVFSIIVLGTTLAILKDALIVLMEGVPRGFSFNSLKASLLEIPGVLAVHDLHVWSLTVGTTAIAVHLVIDDSCSSQMALEEASRICSQEFDIQHSTIQVETSSEKTAECIQCEEPTT